MSPLKSFSHKVNYVSSSSKNTSTFIDYPLLVSSQCSTVQFLSIETLNSKVNHLRLIKLQNTMKDMTHVLDDNKIGTDVDGRGRK